jgi:hypothetical protein
MDGMVLLVFYTLLRLAVPLVLLLLVSTLANRAQYQGRF